LNGNFRTSGAHEHVADESERSTKEGTLMKDLGNKHVNRLRLTLALVGFVALLGTVTCSSPAQKEAKACKNACPIAVETVCASNKEYDNACVAKCAGETEVLEGNCSAAKAAKGG
jgi:hypothetical protein